jgi:hypothetical protein
MKTNKFLLAMFVSLVIAACGNSPSSSTTTATSCGAGSHVNGSNVCVLDDYLAVMNPANTYWSCINNGSRLAFVLVKSTATSGTGTFAPSNSTTLAQLESFTWTATAADGIAMTLANSPGLPPFYSLTQIVPNYNDTTFTAVANVCTLTSGVIGPQLLY